MHNTSHRAFLALGMIFATLSGHTSAAVPINVSLTAANWTTKGDVKLQKIEGFPNGLMENKGSAILNGLVFKNGTIDVDVMFGKGTCDDLARWWHARADLGWREVSHLPRGRPTQRT